MYPHERSLVKRLADEPFTIIGVNSDEELDTLKKALADEHLTWRSFWDGPDGTGGPIATAWNIQGWPSLYLIDHEGILREKWLGSPGDETIDQAVDELVAKAKAAAKD